MIVKKSIEFPHDNKGLVEAIVKFERKKGDIFSLFLARRISLEHKGVLAAWKRTGKMEWLIKGNFKAKHFHIIGGPLETNLFPTLAKALNFFPCFFGCQTKSSESFRAGTQKIKTALTLLFLINQPAKLFSFLS